MDRQTDHALVPRSSAKPQRRGDGLGEVARDAIDQVRDIVSDSVAIGKLEAKRAVEQIGRTTREIVPRVAILAAAAVLGLAGVVLALIAIYIALEPVIPSAAVRLVIFAAVFIIVAAAFGLAARPKSEIR